MLQHLEIKYMDKKVGEFRLADRAFIQHKTTAHLFRMFGNGLGLSYGVIQQLKNLNCHKIKILLHFQAKGKIIGTCACGAEYSETECIESYPDFFLQHGQLWKDANGDYQRIVPLEKLRSYQKELEVVR